MMNRSKVAWTSLSIFAVSTVVSAFTVSTAVAFAMAASVGAITQQADASGTWKILVPATPRGDLEFTAVLSLDGEKLTGTMEGPLGKFDVDGTQKGDAVTFEGLMSQQPPMRIAFQGTLTPDAMSGTVDFAGMFQGEWSGKRGAD